MLGGNNYEHNVSLKTGYSIGRELLKYNKFNILFIAIDFENRWYYSDDIDKIIIYHENIDIIKINTNLPKVYQIGNGKINNKVIDCIFLATHGKYLEDGNLQGFLETNLLKYTGSKTTGSVIGMNKHLSKIIAKSNGINIVDSVCIYNNMINDDIEKSIKELGDKLVVKINSSGSSEGVFFTNYKNKNFFINKAFTMDNIVLIEKNINCRELSIGVIEKNKKLIFSEIGEYIKNDRFFNYEDKYRCNNYGHIIPAEISDIVKKKIIEFSEILFSKLSLNNYARIDFFLENDKLYFNEVNTLPGFYKNSLFVNLWNKINYLDLILLIINTSN